MIFSSFQYFLFLPTVVFLYWRLKGSSRLLLVVAASYFFYMSWMPVYGLLLLALSTLSWLVGSFISKYRDSSPRMARALLVFGIVSNLGCLFYYKYTNFFLANLFHSLGWIGNQMQLAQLAALKAPVLHVILPLGISFFVFEFIHYLVDVYKGSKSVKSWMEFSAFAAFFPSQICGPIKRYQDFIENLRNPIPWSSALFLEAMTLIVQGLFKKIAIADPLGWVIAPSYVSTVPISSTDAWIAFFGFSMQVFCDFSGYTDMGRGSALLLGIRLPVNFQLPFLAEDISDFWRRWHMSLSSWIRDYVYIPLGGSRCSHARGTLNLFMTMAICGLWHGADWQFIAWGCLNGIGLIINREWQQRLDKAKVLQQALSLPPMRIINFAITYMFVASTFVMFRAPNFNSIFNIFASMANTSMESNTMVLLIRTGAPVFGLVYVLFWLLTDFSKKKANLTAPDQLIFPLPLRLAAWTATLLFLFAARPTQATPFIYFQF